MNLAPAYAALLAATVGTRILELAISRRNLAALAREADRAGGRVIRCESAAAFAVMAVLHVLLLAAPALEHALLDRRAPAWLFGAALLAWSAGQALRWASVRALGAAWNAVGAVSTLQPVVRHGVYRRLRHPNYLGVLLEAVALPAAGGAWISLAALTPWIALVTWRRLLAEERLLAELLPEWSRCFADRNRLFPRIPCFRSSS